MDSYAIRGNLSNRIKSTQAITAVEKAMKRYGIPKPPKGQRSRLHHDLPCTPEEKEGKGGHDKCRGVFVIYGKKNSPAKNSRSAEKIQIFKFTFQSS